MRHGKRINHLGRTAAHRKAMLSNMASSLILHKRITTTIAKAKALRPYVEPLLTRAKEDTTHSRRVVFSYLQNKESVRELFDIVSEKISSRPGGYTRIIKTGTRLGDSAEMCVMELVDYNELLLEDADTKKTKTRRGARRKKKSTTGAVAEESRTKDSGEGAVTSEKVEAAGEATAEDQEEAQSAESAVTGDEKPAKIDVEDKTPEEVEASAAGEEAEDDATEKTENGGEDTDEQAPSEDKKSE